MGTEFEAASGPSSLEQRLAELTRELAQERLAREQLQLENGNLRADKQGLLEAAYEKDVRIADLEEEIIHDDLTGLYTRKFIELSAEQLIARQVRHGMRRRGDVAATREVASGPHSLVALDIDHFKLINDTYGHGFGNEVLRLVGILMREKFHRATDVAARIGGEEFAILLPDMSSQAAEAIVNDFRAIVYEDAQSKGITLTFSGGIVTLDDKTFKDSLARADKALYEAKEDGRDKVYIVPSAN
ncbi:MAG: Diguanylate cyclase [Candidatus Saccharibacteria bacterium]|nr:Diguanylate cyclase [Candidatus Saccharibacteria bacterium]